MLPFFFSKQLSFTQTSAVVVKTPGAYARIKVHGKSLEGNLSGEPADRDVSIYLPPSYQAQPSRRYPVVYLLHGYTNSDIGWFGPESRGSFADGNTMTAAADRAFNSAGARDFILVMPNAYTMYQGSMFSNSVTTGDWARFHRQGSCGIHGRPLPNNSGARQIPEVYLTLAIRWAAMARSKSP